MIQSENGTTTTKYRIELISLVFAKKKVSRGVEKGKTKNHL